MHMRSSEAHQCTQQYPMQFSINVGSIISSWNKILLPPKTWMKIIHCTYDDRKSAMINASIIVRERERLDRDLVCNTRAITFTCFHSPLHPPPFEWEFILNYHDSSIIISNLMGLTVCNFSWIQFYILLPRRSCFCFRGGGGRPTTRIIRTETWIKGIRKILNRGRLR